MRYGYQCDSCGAEREVHRSMKDAPSPVACECGSQMRQQFNADVECCVKGGERPYHVDATSVPVGWEHGNTDAEAQQRRYKKIVETERALAKKNERRAARSGIRKIASVPREFQRMRTKQYGKEYLDPSRQTVSELKEKLKSDGLLFNN